MSSQTAYTWGSIAIMVSCSTVGDVLISKFFALSHADVSLVVPAATSLTFVTNAIAARFFLHENVDGRRWAAAVFVCVGVALLAS